MIRAAGIKRSGCYEPVSLCSTTIMCRECPSATIWIVTCVPCGGLIAFDRGDRGRGSTSR